MFTERLKDLRKKRKLTQKDFAIIFNIAQATIGMWETGMRQPDFLTLQKIADYFNVTTDYLLGNSNTSKTNNKNLSPTYELGSAEWLRQGLIARGIIKDNDKLTDEHLNTLLSLLDTIVSLTH